MNLNTEITLAGIPIQIIRDAGNVNTYMFYGALGRIAGKYRATPDDTYQNGYYLPTNCGAVSGDLILADGEYYLLVSIEKVFDNGTLACYKGMLYKCNSVVTIKSFNTTTKKHDTVKKSNVRCLITQVRAQEWNDDKAMVVKEYRGKTQPFQVFMRASEGLTKDDIIIDQDNHRFRIGKDFDVFTSDGITQTQVVWEVSD